MKKVFALIVLVVLFVASTASAEDIDLSNLSFDELVALRNRISLVIWESDEWQEVTVPLGVWKVGESIPEGTWTIRCEDKENSRYTQINVCDVLDETGTKMGRGEKRVQSDLIGNPNAKNPYKGSMTEYTVTLENGDYVIIEHSPAVFTPYMGKPDLGFKFNN